jgi:NAD(P)-dependent dehydrogenase (short-subunit alcohol dehydrogenase family)
VLATGTTRGIGRAIAEQVARNGGAFILMSSVSASMGTPLVVDRGTIFNSLG